MRIVLVPLHLIPESEVLAPEPATVPATRRSRRRQAVLRYLQLLVRQPPSEGLLRVACWVAAHPAPAVRRGERSGYTARLARHLRLSCPQARRLLHQLTVHPVYRRLF